MRALIVTVLLLVLVGGGFLFVTRTDTGAQLLTSLPGRGDTDTSSPAAGANASVRSGLRAQGAQNGDSEMPTVAIRPADSILGEVSASGNIELVSLRSVAFQVDGEVREIAVKPGDVVAAGDLLLVLDTAALERDAQRARLDVESAKNQVDQLNEPADAADVAAAEADLAQAREALAETEAGPGAEEIAAAQSRLASAQAYYEELQAGPSDAELTQLSADLKKKEVALAQAQGEYDKIAWNSAAGMTSQAVDLEDATIDYESALAAFEEATEPASASDLASAESSIRDAQAQLGDLLSSPTEAEIAQARAAVAQAEAALAELQVGPTELDLADANVALEKAVLDLQEAYNDLAMAQITAPIDGTVLEVNVEEGELVSRGSSAATLANTALLELTIDVAEIDIPKVTAGQPATVEIDALPGRSFQGVVDYLAPAGDSSSGLINYPVTIRLEEGKLADVLPGMTAVATLMNTSTDLSDAWLVPANAIRQLENGAAITVLREGTPRPVSVEVGNAEGEWTVVRSPELQADDMVVGSVTSFVGENNFRFGPGAGGGMRPPGAGR